MKGPLAVEELLLLLFALFEMFTDADVLIEEVSDLLDWIESARSGRDSLSLSVRNLYMENLDHINVKTDFL